MTFNKHFPDRQPVPIRGLTPEQRAWALRLAWYASTAMLVAGYVILFIFWDR